MLSMSTSTYLLDSALILIVLLQIKERKMTMRTLIRPLVILGAAVAIYFSTLPTQGNDLLLILAVSGIGAIIGIASGLTAIMRNRDGEVTLRTGWLSGFFWVLGMGGRFAFAYWSTHGGISALSTFSAHHQITSGQAWTDALLGMAVLEVALRTAIVGYRWKVLENPVRRLALA
jgi:hypothetical protein